MLDNNKKELKQILTTLLLLLIIGVLTYMPLVGKLGYYRDDWHVVWAGYTQGAQEIIELHKIDRPVMGVIYSLNYRLLGANPLNWHIYSFAIRMIGVFSFYWLLRLVWPGKKDVAALASLLFLIYPGFLEQPTANAYSNHLLGFTFGLISLSLTVYAYKSKKPIKKSLVTLIAMLFGAGCYLIMEYMIGIEGIRIVLLWYLEYKEKHQKFFKTILYAVKRWAPYLFILGIFLIWRIFVFNSARSVTDVGAIGQLYLQNPIEMFSRLFIETIKDIFETIVLAWFVPFYRFTAGIKNFDLLISILLAAVGVGLFIVYWRWNTSKDMIDSDESYDDNSWTKAAFWIGLLTVASTIFPVIIANRDVRFEDTFDRYTLVGSMGVSLIIVSFLYKNFNQSKRILIAGVLIGISMITHYQNSVYFKNFWEYQKQLWWQLSWRAPDFDDYTVLIPYLPDGYRLAESYEIWGPANIIYYPDEQSPRLVGDPLNDETLFYLQNQDTIGRSVRKVEFTVDWKNPLIMTIPSSSSCLHVYDGNRLELSEYESALIRLTSSASRIGLIMPGEENKKPPKAIFGDEPEHGWCYYYQSASLARQRGDWQEVVRLGEEAARMGLSPSDVSEWMPFYEGYANLSMFDQANNIAAEFRMNPNFINTYCSQFVDNEAIGTPIKHVNDFVIKNLCGQ